MNTNTSAFKRRLLAGEPVIAVEISPAAGSTPESLKQTADTLKPKVHALGISDNRGEIGMSPLAAASLISSCGVEPIMHLTTRDRNRIALISDVLGARALGIFNLLITTGTHQTLGSFGAAKNVFDLDSVQLLKECSGKGTILGSLNGSGPEMCLGATAAPFADPAELQLMQLRKKVAMGAEFIITQPVFDLEGFGAFWRAVTERRIHEQAAFIAGILPLLTVSRVREMQVKRPNPRIPEAMLKRLTACKDDAAVREEGIGVAVEIIKGLRPQKGLRGFEIRSEGDSAAALEIIEKSGLGSA